MIRKCRNNSNVQTENIPTQNPSPFPAAVFPSNNAIWLRLTSIPFPTYRERHAIKRP